MSVRRLRLVTIGLFVAAAVLTTAARQQGGPVFAAGVACFSGGVLVFFQWRRAQREEIERARVFAQEEKTAEETPE